MAYYLQCGSASNNHTISLAVAIPFNVDYYVEMDAEVSYAASPAYSPIVYDSVGLYYHITRHNGYAQTGMRLGGSFPISGNINQYDNGRFTYRFARSATAYTTDIDGNTVFSFNATNGFNIREMCRGVSMKLYSIKIYNSSGTLIHNYDPSATGGTGLVLEDTVGGNDGTLVNFPTDDSQWVFYDAGGAITVTGAFTIAKPTFAASGAATLPSPTGSIAFTITKPSFSASGTATLPQPSGSAAFTIDKPVFSASGTASLPFPQGAIAFTIAKPIFSATGTATTPNPIGTVAFEIAKPSFSATGSATLPQPVGDIAFTISKPTFAATGSATVPFPQGSIAFTIEKPTFSGAGSATLPNPSGVVSFSIDKPIFAAFGTVSGFSFTYANNAITTIDSPDNVTTVTVGANIVIID